MAVDNKVLNLASDKKFTEFSKAIKQELKNKLSNHKEVKQYVSDYDKIQQMKDSFAEISKIGKPVEPVVPKDPDTTTDVADSE
jgi:5'-deoxynucleotidase YfbR-like HD superfamily hydrolase